MKTFELEIHAKEKGSRRNQIRCTENELETEENETKNKVEDNAGTLPDSELKDVSNKLNPKRIFKNHTCNKTRGGSIP
jgi:hypothetical protein